MATCVFMLLAGREYVAKGWATGLGQGDRKQIDKMQTLFLVVFGAAVPVSWLEIRRPSHKRSIACYPCG